jgi:hypothetical protein
MFVQLETRHGDGLTVRLEGDRATGKLRSSSTTHGPKIVEGRVGQRVDSRERCRRLVGKPMPSRELGRRGLA